MRRILRIVIPALIFLAGLGVLLYPVFSDLWNQHRQNTVMDTYQRTVTELDEEDYSAWLEAAQRYNQSLDPAFHDAFTGKDPAAEDPYWSLLDPDGTGMMGYLEIPSISLRLPVYHGTGEEALQKGIGHLAGTSLPVGGTGTHCVLSGHRGLPTALLFTDLDQLTAGDRFYLHVLGETLAYEVDQISVVEPDQVSDLTGTQTGDYVTLLTCTPYGVNTHRLLVRGHRVAMEQTAAPKVTVTQQVVRSFGWRGKLLLAIAALVVLAVAVEWIRRKAKKKRS